MVLRGRNCKFPKTTITGLTIVTPENGRPPRFIIFPRIKRVVENPILMTLNEKKNLIVVGTCSFVFSPCQYLLPLTLTKTHPLLEPSPSRSLWCLCSTCLTLSGRFRVSIPTLHPRTRPFPLVLLSLPLSGVEERVGRHHPIGPSVVRLGRLRDFHLQGSLTGGPFN